MYAEPRDSYVSKFDSPFTAWLYGKSLDSSWWDEVTGETDWAERVILIGKRLLFEDDRGFVTSERYASEAEARARFDTIDAAYSAWLVSDDEG